MFCFVDRDHQRSVVVADHSWKFKAQFFKPRTFQEKTRENYYLNLKKRKVKNLKVVKKPLW